MYTNYSKKYNFLLFLIISLYIDLTISQFPFIYNYFSTPHRINESARSSRFLPLFTLVHFKNQDCIGATGDNGTCLTASECSHRRGTNNGPCAGGYGICCMFFSSCGTTIWENGTYFVNNGYPNTIDGTGSCQTTIMKSNPNICQFRLDFEQFTIMGPEPVHHICNNDQFIVSGGSAIPPICGTNSNNHLYVNSGVEYKTGVTLSVITSGTAFARVWKIRITQIQCNSYIRAEEGCLQYFTGVSGQIRSFNYDVSTGLQLSSQDYTICIRNELNFCGIQYAQCQDPAHNRSLSFSLSGNTLAPVPAMVGSTGTVNSCQSDFIIIPMAFNVGRRLMGLATSVDRICGGTFAAEVTMISTPVRSNVKPFRMWVHTDSVEAPHDIANRGFCLIYVQHPCSNSAS